jgi:hypothetical protein
MQPGSKSEIKLSGWQKRAACMFRLSADQVAKPEPRLERADQSIFIVLIDHVRHLLLQLTCHVALQPS